MDGSEVVKLKQKNKKMTPKKNKKDKPEYRGDKDISKNTKKKVR